MLAMADSQQEMLDEADIAADRLAGHDAKPRICGGLVVERR